MFFTSTRQKLNVTAAQAIAQGISKDGGLFVPSEFPKFSQEMLDKLVNMNYTRAEPGCGRRPQQDTVRHRTD